MEAVKGKILKEDYIGVMYAVMDANALPNHSDLSHLAVLCDVLRTKDIALPSRRIDWSWLLCLLPSASSPRKSPPSARPSPAPRRLSPSSMRPTRSSSTRSPRPPAPDGPQRISCPTRSGRCPPESEQDEENLSSDCGVFKPSDVVMCIDIAKFSHRMNCGRNKLESLYRIHSNKGEIWANYAGWNCNWRRTDQANCEYWVVEIVSEGNCGFEVGESGGV
ncbi:hypothetical protein QJS10_CPB13g01358 [Acorus calamus]|uniref:DUF3444 domain-containing protein n=1 Tax=Acorus calamus TaxID=4465 RepID=A0AAV9DG29_ACOCL|nr:hypothetical protein QJS10_CPB13g01358 [Acorus calamus]